MGSFRHILTLFIALSSLGLGVLIYGGWRPHPPVILERFWAHGLGSLVGGSQSLLQSLNYVLPDWMVYSLPQGLWVFSYTLIVGSIWQGNGFRSRFWWFCTAFLFAAGWELGQLFHWIGGTFCWVDLSVGIGAFFLGYFITK